jgi:hypothetical protein
MQQVYKEAIFVLNSQDGYTGPNAFKIMKVVDFVNEIT